MRILSKPNSYYQHCCPIHYMHQQIDYGAKHLYTGHFHKYIYTISVWVYIYILAPNSYRFSHPIELDSFISSLWPLRKKIFDSDLSNLFHASNLFSVPICPSKIEAHSYTESYHINKIGRRQSKQRELSSLACLTVIHSFKIPSTTGDYTLSLITLCLSWYKIKHSLFLEERQEASLNFSSQL